MQFESRHKRRMWLNSLLGIIPDALIAAALAVAFDGGMLGFLLAIAGLQVVYLAIWAKNSIWSWTMFSLFNRKYASDLLQDYLRSRNFPEPEEHQRSIESFLEGLATNEAQPFSIRVSAAAELAVLNYPTSQGRFQEGLQVTMAYEDALIAYKRSFPPNAAAAP